MRNFLFLTLFFLFSCNKCEIKDGIYLNKNYEIEVKRMDVKYEVKIFDMYERTEKFMIFNCDDKNIQSGKDLNTVIFEEQKLVFEEPLVTYKRKTAQSIADSLAVLEISMDAEY
jgi:hypothetical protein